MDSFSPFAEFVNLPMLPLAYSHFKNGFQKRSIVLQVETLAQLSDCITAMEISQVPISYYF